MVRWSVVCNRWSRLGFADEPTWQYSYVLRPPMHTLASMGEYYPTQHMSWVPWLVKCMMTKVKQNYLMLLEKGAVRRTEGLLIKNYPTSTPISSPVLEPKLFSNQQTWIAIQQQEIYQLCKSPVLNRAICEYDTATLSHPPRAARSTVGLSMDKIQHRWCRRSRLGSVSKPLIM